MLTFFIAILITIIIAQWFILWVDKAFFEACIAEITDQGKTIDFLEEQVAAQQDAMHAAFERDFKEACRVSPRPQHTREDTFQVPLRFDPFPGFPRS